MSKIVDIENDIVNKIISNEWEANYRVPSEKDLSLIYDVNRHTIRKVLENLIETGYIRRGHKTPAYVNETNLFTNFLSYASMHSQCEKDKIYCSLHEFKKVKLNALLEEKFNTNKYSEFWKIIRIRWSETKHKHIEEIYMPCSLFPELKPEDAEKSLYDYVNNFLNTKINHAYMDIKPILMSSHISQLLECDKEIGLELHTFGYLENGKMFEYSIVTSIEDSFKIYKQKI